MSVGCRSVEYRLSVGRVSVGTVLAECRKGVSGYSIGRVLIGYRSVEYWPSVDRVSVGRVTAEC